MAPLRSDGLLVDDTKEKAEILNRQYFSVFTTENTDEQLPPLNDNFQSMPEIKVTILGTEKLLKNLDPTKATGPDQIPARILKQFAAEFAPHLTTIFNTSITKGEVPTDWRQANVIKVITKLPNSEQSYKGKVKTHNYINRQNQSTTGKL